MITRQQAAALRADRVRTLGDRPSQRRDSDGGASSRVSVRAKVAVEDAGTALTFDGYASITERGYEMWDAFGPYTEVVSTGAFESTLNRSDLDVPLVLAHDQLRRIARTTNGTLTLTEDAEGLRVQATLDPADADVAYIAPKLRAGLIDEMSFGFRIVRGRWSPDYTEYRIEETDMHRGDTAIVGWGANPFTSGTLRDLVEAAPEPEARAALAALELRFKAPIQEPFLSRI